MLSYPTGQTWLEEHLRDYNATVSSRPAKGVTRVYQTNVTFGRRRKRGALAGRQERKYFDTNLVGTLASTLLIPSLNPVPQGTTLTDRVGRKIYIQSLQCTYSFVLATTPTLSEMVDEVRVLIVVDKQSNGGSPDITDLLESEGTRKFHNLDHSSRFSFIYDKRFSLNTIAGGGTHNFESNINGRLFKKFRKPIVIEFESPGTGDLSTITASNVLCFVLADNGAKVEIDFAFRIRFTDGL